MSLTRFLGAAVGCLYRERRLSPERMAEVQRARLAALLAHAKATTPLYAERIEDPSPDHLDRIEPITKPELMARFDDSIANRALTLEQARVFTEDPANVGRLYDGRFVVATTSGTTGRVGYFVTDRDAWARLNGGLLARILRHRLVPHEIIRFCWGRRYRMAMTIATGGHYITALVSTFQPLLARAFMKMSAFSVTSPLEETVARLNRYRPHYLHSYPTYLEVLAGAQLAGELAIDPEFVSLGSEPVSQLARETIRRAFPNAEVSETYGATECLTIGNQCKLGNLHVNEDLCVLEPVDADGRPVPAGTPSARVYLTNLENYGQPLIRYVLEDSVTVLEGQCGCGAAFPMIRVEGRSDDTFYLEDDAGAFRAFPPVPFEVLFLDLRGLLQYQLVHEAQNVLSIRYVADAGADASALTAELERRFSTYFADNHVGRLKLDVAPVDSLERQAQGHKLRQIYSKVPRPG